MADIPENPITREEIYLAKMSQQEVELPKPITRQEMYLNYIAEKFDRLPEAYIVKGNSTFANLPTTLTEDMNGYVYNVTEDFTTTALFVEGVGKKYSAGTNVVIVNLGDETNPDMKYDVMSNFVDIDSINSQIQAVSDMIANEFDITANYAIGDVVVYEDTLYKFITTHTAGAWNNQEVMQVTVYDIFTGVAKNITYSALKTLRDNNKLLAGQQYRITDYTCTTTQSDTQSAGHTFDIIVTADSTNTLNENARAIHHTAESTDYFYGQDLAAWELKYDLDNDVDKYAWADSTNGKGVIYWLKDEYGNECGYDFKNIQMKFYKITATTRTSTDLIGTYSGSRYVGINNGSLVPSNCTIDANDSEFRYTFDLFTDNAHKDYSLNQYFNNDKNCYDNIINTLFGNASNQTKNKRFVNIISFRNTENNTNCYGNKQGDRNYNNSFGNGCRFISFGDNCYSISFGNACNSISFGNACNSNSFGNGCFSNSFGDNCYSISFGNACNSNSFGNGCRFISFGDNCYSISFGNACNSNSFGNACGSNSFGNSCGSNSFGNSCRSNSFGNACTNNIFAANTQYAMYGNNSTPILTKIVSITYNQLVTLKNNSKFISGQQYRITDYTCTTTQSDTQSAGNVFDIIVTADSINTLNENARAIHHTAESTDYFYGQDLAAWELKYSIDNDVDKYAWADSANGKGVIYWLKDEYGNECGYDFKNIQMKFYKITATTSTFTDLVNTYSASRYAGVENGTLVPSNCTIDANDFEWRYTFDLFTNNSHNDYSLNNYSSNGKYCYDNKINVLYGNANDNNTYNKQFINIISFRNIDTKAHCYGNEFSDKNFNFSFGSNCFSNSFGNSCYSNSFGNSCHSNSFGNFCFSNSFGNSCNANSFRNSCYSNSFGNSCHSNSFENRCGSNSFGNGCNANSFGNSCSYNSFGSNCFSNSFGNDCKSNSFGNGCNANSFGNSCSNNTFAANTQYAMYGNNNAQIQVAT